MQFRLSALPAAPFRDLLTLDEATLARRGVLRLLAEAGAPCRVSLRDAEAGETVYLLTWEHHPVPGPFRASGPIFVREAADRAAAPGPGEVPEQIRSRLLSVRAYDAQGMMLDADVTEGAGLEGAIERFFGHEAIGYLHVHFARRGCYGCRVDRC